MKLIDKDGEVIETLDDDCACVFITPDGRLSSIFPKGKPQDIVPLHVKLVGALTVFLTDKANVELVLRVLPQPRNTKHRHN